MKKLKIYIVGKISGLDYGDARRKFTQAERDLNLIGFTAVNPTKLVSNPDCKWDEAMKICIKTLVDCDGIYLLPDWERSRGAVLERKIAEALGLTVFYPDDLDRSGVGSPDFHDLIRRLLTR